MNWKLIDKTNTLQPKPENGTLYKEFEYRDWKPILAKEGFYQCVYCSISDSKMGGIRIFHVEHYRPKKNKNFNFSHLVNQITNLFYACPICNSFKSNDWYEEEKYKDLDKVHYPNPSEINYATLFEVDDNGYLTGKNKAGIFLIERLALNRSQLILDRKFNMLLQKWEAIIMKCSSLSDKLMECNQVGSKSFLKDIIEFKTSVGKLMISLNNSSPYASKDTKK